LLYGRYCKYSREVSQTPWIVEGGKTTIHGSVEGHISSKLAPFFGSEQGILHGSGREDIDVRMLG
jgi:tRNA pseudouridine synthase 10